MGLFDKRQSAAVAATVEPEAVPTADSAGVTVVATVRFPVFDGRETPFVFEPATWDAIRPAKREMLARSGVVQSFTDPGEARRYVQEGIARREQLAREAEERAAREAERQARIAAIESAAAVVCDGVRVPGAVWAAVPDVSRQRLAADGVVEAEA